MNLLASAQNLPPVKFSKNFIESIMKKAISSFLTPLEAEVIELSDRIEKLTLQVREFENKVVDKS